MKLFQTIQSGDYKIYLLFCIAIMFLVFLIGITFFSYLNIVIEKLPKKEKLTDKRLTCKKCGHAFTFSQSIPIFSYLRAKGRCSYCFETLPIRSLILEIMGGVIACVIVLYYGLSVEALLMFLLYSVLVVISFIDYDTMEIPPVLNGCILAFGVIDFFIVEGPTLLERIIGFFCVSLVLFIIILIIPEGFGGGDIKLIAAAGFFLGWKACVVAFFIGLILGGAYGGYLLVSKKEDRKAHFAFGPFLAVGIAVAAYAGIGTSLMNMYLAPIVRVFH